MKASVVYAALHQKKPGVKPGSVTLTQGWETHLTVQSQNSNACTTQRRGQALGNAPGTEQALLHEAAILAEAAAGHCQVTALTTVTTQINDLT
jgi:hypothetical protein